MVFTPTIPHRIFFGDSRVCAAALSLFCDDTELIVIVEAANKMCRRVGETKESAVDAEERMIMEVTKTKRAPSTAMMVMRGILVVDG